MCTGLLNSGKHCVVFNFFMFDVMAILSAKGFEVISEKIVKGDSPPVSNSKIMHNHFVLYIRLYSMKIHSKMPHVFIVFITEDLQMAVLTQLHVLTSKHGFSTS